MYVVVVRCMERLDELTGRDVWKHSEDIDPNTSDYDIATVRRKKNELLDLRQKGDVDGLVQCIKTCLDNHLYSTLSPALYSMAYSGTKIMSEQLQDEVAKSIDYVSGNANESCC